MAALIGSLRASLSADTANFEQGMRRAQRQAAASGGAINKSLGGIKAGMAGLVAGLSVGMLTSVIKNALDYAGSLGEISQQLGVTTRDLQNFRAIAGQNGVSTEEMDKALGKLTVTLGQVAAGAKAPAKALQAIGISARDLAGKDTGEAFRMIADGLSRVEDRAQRAAVEVALFGRTGAKLDTVLSGGSARINELAAANERLGGVLSDEQIQRADETADKLEQLKTVLSAQIAGVVADNSDAILGMANALSTLIGWLGTAMRSYRAFVATAQWAAAQLQQLRPSAEGRSSGRVNEAAASMQLRDLSNQERGGSSMADRAARLRRGLGLVAPSSGSGAPPIPQFLGSGGSGGGGKPKAGPRGKSAEQLAEEAERKRREAAQKLFRFEQDEMRAQADILRAKRDLSTDYVERASISVQILDLQRQSHAHEMANAVAEGEITQAQADRLAFLYDQNDALERQKIQQDEDAQAYEDSTRLDELSLDLQRDALESEAQLARTAAEQRAVQLRLLDLSYKMERARLQAVLADQQASEAAKEEARRRLAGLEATYGNDRESVIQGTRNPLEEWANSIPRTAGEVTEAFQEIQASGLDALAEGITGVITGTEKMGEAFSRIAKQIIADLIMMTVRMMIFRALSAAIGGAGTSPGGDIVVTGLPQPQGFATGGSFHVLGRRGTDKNILSLNSLPIARVSHGERIGIGTADGGGSARDVTIHQTFQFEGVAVTEDQFVRGLAMTKQSTIASIRDMNRRAG